MFPLVASRTINSQILGVLELLLAGKRFSALCHFALHGDFQETLPKH
jgi:hypothetical protein